MELQGYGSWALQAAELASSYLLEALRLLGYALSLMSSGILSNSPEAELPNFNFARTSGKRSE
jgi:hypothetical protein